uniref:PHD-type domain-containing protein n=1 Tax=Knipowitschia caucasica TaxID=637954 RepID=A0AAV2MNV7_KNICA
MGPAFTLKGCGIYVVMAQPPGRADDHQTPQDLSTSSRTEQCAVVRRNPGWYQNSDQGSPILPDNALSRTTVTLSYVSRSHVFSTQDSLCGNSNVYGVPTFSKYSLQPLCQLDASSNALDQPFLENIDGPIDTDLLQSLSEAQLDLDLETNLKQTFELGTSEQHNEPEIKLKYLNYKEEKRSQKTDRFSPFVRVHRQPQAPSLCTVLSNPEEVKTPRKSGQASTEYASVNVPATSCLRLGRVSMHGAQQRALVCCLCKQAANAMDLGDLHGPYYSQGYQPPPKIPHDQSGLKEGESSDSDSSSCSATKWTSIKRQLKWKAAEGSSHVVKRARAEVDWYTPPILPLDPCEYWLHEDCGVWATGVFLIRGRLYGLEEAVKAAHNAECCACGGPGASLGCLSKACPSKYHYRCALRSDCALDQDNFSMRCRKHKNVSMRGLTSRRLEPS